MAPKRKPEPKPEPISDEEEEVVVEEEEEEEDDEAAGDVGDEEDLSSRESIRKLLEPFGKDQLIDLLKDAALTNPAIISRISRSKKPTTTPDPKPKPPSSPSSALDPAKSDPADRKIFVYSLGWDTTNETLSAAFAPFGDIEDCRAIADRSTGRCKGFGFVLFRTPEAARKSLKEPQKKIGNRTAFCQLASVGPVGGGGGGGGNQASDPGSRKIFVTGVGDHVGPERLRAFFARFGEIEEGPLGCDPVTGRLLRFAIFIFRTTEGCRRALEQPVKYFEGCELYCKGESAAPEPKLNPPVGLQPYDLALLGRTPAGFMGQNAGFGLTYPVTDTVPVASAYAGYGGGSSGPSGVNSISSSVTDRYASSAALYGLGAYRSSPSRYQSADGYSGAGLPSYYGRY